MAEELKSAQVSASSGAVITLVVGVGIATLMLIFVGVLGGATYTENEADIDAIYATATNENIGTANGSGGLVATVKHIPINSITAIKCNASTVPVANYSYTAAGVVTVTNHRSECKAAWVNVTYVHGNHSIEVSVKNAVAGGFEALDTTGGYMPLVVLAVIIALVMSMVLGMGGRNGGRPEGMTL